MAFAPASPPFLETDPPHWAARGLAYLLILVFIGSIAGSVLVKIPDVVSSPFTLAPVRGSDPVRAPRRGIVADVKVVEGQVVNVGDVLFIIGSQDVGDRSGERRGLETQVVGSGESLVIARRKRENERQAEREEAVGLERRVADLARMIEVKQGQIKLKAEVVERRGRLHAEGLTSWEDFATHQLEARQLALEFEQLQTDQQSARALLARLVPEARAREAEFAELERRLREDVVRSEIRVGVLREELVPSDGTTVSSPAPCAGTILHLVVRARGAVVQEGDVLADVACAGELQAELAVPQSGIGRVQQGQPVKLLYDAFPYQRFGVKSGAVRWVSPASVALGGNNVFRVLVEPLDRTILVDGQERTILPGMSGRAEIVVGRRSLLTYALAPLRQLQESISAPPKPSR